MNIFTNFLFRKITISFYLFNPLLLTKKVKNFGFAITYCYQGFDWDGLSTRTLSPPILPTVHSKTDTSNFDKFPRDAAVPKDENSGWDLNF